MPAAGDNQPFMLGEAMLAHMHPDELRQTMFHLGCSTATALAEMIGVSRSCVSGWLRGTVGVPRHVAMLLRMLEAKATCE